MSQSNASPSPSVKSAKASSMPASSQGAGNTTANGTATTPTLSAASNTPSAPEREKPRLTEQEKKNNHIASEQKRRAAIREGFDRLTELVPGIEGQGRSEGMVLRKTVDFMQLKLQERKELIREIEWRGGVVDERLRQEIQNR